MINDYLDIVSEQLRLIIKSGLYANCDCIHVGCLGPAQERAALDVFFHDHSKIKIVTHSTDLEKYEFQTLKILKSESTNALPVFYGFYIHTKGVSYPGNEGGKYWRDYMNYYILTNWKEAVLNLSKGYEVYGVKLQTIRDLPAKKMHYSGNFFWFKSEYAKTLPNIDSLDQKNRFEAEMYICLNNPIAATGCQEFIDYDTLGTFKPPIS